MSNTYSQFMQEELEPIVNNRFLESSIMFNTEFHIKRLIKEISETY
jgi:hypothetical protein